MMERRFLGLCRKALLPLPHLNAWIPLPIPAGGLEVDFTWPDRRLAVETDSATFHGTTRARRNDPARDRAFMLAGWRVARYTWWHITAEPQRVASEVRAPLEIPPRATDSSPRAASGRFSTVWVHSRPLAPPPTSPAPRAGDFEPYGCIRGRSRDSPARRQAPCILSRRMAKKVLTMIKLQIPAGAANPAPPVGPALGQHGVNIMEFCKAFNAQTQQDAGTIIPVEITVYEDRSFDFITKTPPAAVLIKEAISIEKGSGEPNREKVGKISAAQVRQIAERKMPDLNANDLDAASKIIAGTARSMGVDVEGLE